MADMRLKQHIMRILLVEVILDVSDSTDEVVLTLHWTGGQHSQVRVQRVKTGRYPTGQASSAVEAVQKMGGRWPDRGIARWR